MSLVVASLNPEAFFVFPLFTRGLMDLQNPKPALEQLGQCLERA